MPLASKLRQKGVTKLPQRKRPIWGGPIEEGVTQSLLNKFIVCRERFRIRVVEGLKAPDQFNHRMEYGQMWHTCEEAFGNNKDWQVALKKYAQDICRKYPLSQQVIQHWYNVCVAQYPIWLKHSKSISDSKLYTPLSREKVFSIPYKLPSGRIVLLRGKIDSLDIYKKGKQSSVYFADHKTKSEIDRVAVERQLTFDLQTMFYIIALQTHYQTTPETGDDIFPEDHGPIAGVRYNLIRRPLSGGKDSIRQRKDEDASSFYTRLGELIADHPQEYFLQFKSEISSVDIKRFEQRCFIPKLEQLCDWWEFIIACPNKDPWHTPKPSECIRGQWSGIHDQHPFGIYNVMDEGGHHDMDNYILNGSETGLEYNPVMFSELE